MNGIWIALLVALWLVVMLEAIFIVAILRLVGDLQARLKQVADQQGTPAPLTLGREMTDGTFTSLTGKEISLSSLWRRGKLLLFFVSTGCVPCRDTLKRFSELYVQAVEAGWQICVLCSGPSRLATFLVEDAALPTEVPFAAVDQDQTLQAFGVTATPTLVVVGGDGRVRGVMAGSADTEQLHQILFGYPSPAFAS